MLRNSSQSSFICTKFVCLHPFILSFHVLILKLVSCRQYKMVLLCIHLRHFVSKIRNFKAWLHVRQLLIGYILLATLLSWGCLEFCVSVFLPNPFIVIIIFSLVTLHRFLSFYLYPQSLNNHLFWTPLIAWKFFFPLDFIIVLYQSIQICEGSAE